MNSRGASSSSHDASSYLCWWTEYISLINERASSPDALVLVALATVVVMLFSVMFVRTATKNKNNSKQTGRTNGCLPPMPPSGVSLNEFLEAITNGKAAAAQLRWRDEYGPYFTVVSPLPWLIPNLVYVSEPATVRELTIRQANMYRVPTKFTTRDPNFAALTRNTVGVGVTGLVGEEWRWRKDALMKEFKRRRLFDNDRALIEKIVQEGRKLCGQFEVAASSNPPVIEVDLATTGAAVGVILFFLFGRDIEFDAKTLRRSALDLMDVLGTSMNIPGYGFFKYIPGTLSHQKEQQKLRAWKAIDDIVVPELEMLLKESTGQCQVHPDRKPGSVIESLLRNEPRFQRGGVQKMIAEVRVFVQAGFETTAHSLAFAFGMMAERPDLASKIVKEGNDAYKKYRLPPSNKHDDDSLAFRSIIDETPYVKNFFMESLRLYPLAPALGGITTDDVVIIDETTIMQSDGGDDVNNNNNNNNNNATAKTLYGLPKGTSLYFPNVALQRHKRYSGGQQGEEQLDPNEIIPDRWNVPPTQQPFLHTFNSGPHACPGKPLSMLEGHIFLLMAAMKYEFEFPESNDAKCVEYEEKLLLRPKDGMPLIVKKRVLGGK